MQWLSKCCSAAPIGKIETDDDDDCWSAFGFCKDCGERAVFTVSGAEGQKDAVKYTPEKITKLSKNEVFVFGSNLAGRHGAGAAKVALVEFGAVYGKGEGLQGLSYALPTKDEHIQTLPLPEIDRYITNFISCAVENQHLTFFCTKIGCGLAGLDISQIAPMFWSKNPPKNVVFPKAFHEYKP